MNLPNGLFSQDFKEVTDEVVFCSLCNEDALEIEVNRKGLCTFCQLEEKGDDNGN